MIRRDEDRELLDMIEVVRRQARVIEPTAEIGVAVFVERDRASLLLRVDLDVRCGERCAVGRALDPDLAILMREVRREIIA